ncbi:MAG: Hpt domain-containing protein [Spirochaetales bacterium]|nr:Hpt domain-containing protein [Spirochaetales bacterium]
MDTGIYDCERTATELGLEPGLVLKLLKDFIAAKEEYLIPIEKAIETGDLEALFESAHALKGTALELRIKSLSDAAGLVTEGIKQKKKMDYRAIFLSIKDTFNRLEQSYPLT